MIRSLPSANVLSMFGTDSVVIDTELTTVKQRIASLMDSFRFEPSPPQLTLPQSTTPSTTTTIEIAVPPSSLPLSAVSETVSSLSQSLLQIELLFLDCQGDFSALPSGSLPLAERMEDLQNRLSFLIASSNAVESRMKVGVGVGVFCRRSPRSSQPPSLGRSTC